MEITKKEINGVRVGVLQKTHRPLLLKAQILILSQKIGETFVVHGKRTKRKDGVKANCGVGGR